MTDKANIKTSDISINSNSGANTIFINSLIYNFFRTIQSKTVIIEKFSDKRYLIHIKEDNYNSTISTSTNLSFSTNSSITAIIRDIGLHLRRYNNIYFQSMLMLSRPWHCALSSILIALHS